MIDIIFACAVASAIIIIATWLGHSGGPGPAFNAISQKIRAKSKFEFKNLSYYDYGKLEFGTGILTYLNYDDEKKWIRRISYLKMNGAWHFLWDHCLKPDKNGYVSEEDFKLLIEKNSINDPVIVKKLNRLVQVSLRDREREAMRTRRMAEAEEQDRKDQEKRKKELHLIKNATLYEGSMNKHERMVQEGQLAIVERASEGALSFYEEEYVIPYDEVEEEEIKKEIAIALEMRDG